MKGTTMQFEITEEDRSLIPSLAGLVAVAVGGTAYAIHVHRSEKKKRNAIQKDRAVFAEAHKKRMKRVQNYNNEALKRQRARLDEILRPLREDGIIDF
jgi:hypothetical protein